MKKINIVIVILIVALLASCENSPQEPDKQNSENKKEMIVNKSEPAKFIAEGKIVKIEKENIHVQDKDKVDVYNVNPERTSKLYIGEYVGINKLEGDNFDVVLDENHDYNTRLTSEGKEIYRVTGTVGDVSNEDITIATETEQLKLRKSRDFDLSIGEQLMADYVELIGSKQMLAYYDEASKINVNIKEIARDINGTMRIYALSDSKVEYDIMVGADTITNFRHSSLELNDDVIVYPNDISGDVPALVDAKLILLNNDK